MNRLDKRFYAMARFSETTDTGKPDVFRSPVWRTKDDQLVLHPTGYIRRKWRRIPLGQLTAGQVKEETEHLVTACARENEVIFLLEADEDAFDLLVADIDRFRSNVWVVSENIDQLTRWRTRTDSTLLISTRLKSLKQGPERFAADLQSRSIDGVHMFHSDWNGGLLTMFHRFGLLTFAYGADQSREMANLIDAGIDGIQTSQIERLRTVSHQFDHR